MALSFPLPTFNNEAVSELYTLSTNAADVARIREILALGEALIPDLERVLSFSDERQDDFATTELDEDAYNDAPLHALMMLAELRATSSFATGAHFLADEEVWEYWLGDTFFTVCERFYTYCGTSSIEEMKRVVEDRTLETLKRTMPAYGLGWIGVVFPEYRPSIVEFFRTYLRSDEHNVIEIPPEKEGKHKFWVAKGNEDTSAMVSSQLAFQGYTELREEIESLWLSGKAFPGITTIESVRKDLENPLSSGNPIELLPIKSLEEVYDWIETPFRPNFDLIDELFPPEPSDTIPQGLIKKDAHSTTLVRTEAKIGRNDPCPLDGKKKFKKCCGAKGHTTCQIA
ncbi:MAG: hypothetical protein ACOVSW_01840 [Candidatus Kapaibacteriota bacterium]